MGTEHSDPGTAGSGLEDFMNNASHEEYQSALRKLVEQRCISSGLDPGLLSNLIKDTGAVWQEHLPRQEDFGDGTYKAMSPVFRIVIRDDLLKPLDFFLNLVRHCISLSISFASMLSPVSALGGAKGVADAIWNLYELFKKLAASGHFLTSEEFAVVSELQRLGEGSPEAIAEQLRNIDAQFVLATLRKFEHVGPGDTRFTRLNAAGNWELVSDALR